MFKKILSLALALVMVASLGFAMVSCGETVVSDMTEAPLAPVTLTKDFDIDPDFKVGFILLHDEASTYDLNFINAVNNVKEVLGLSDSQVLFKKNIPESNACYEAAVDLVDAGCDVIFADSFGHESHLIKAAEEFPEVQFCHATGTMAHTAGLSNFHNAFASIYEGRFLAGVAAGLKLNEMITAGKITAAQAKIGYVGAFTYAEVISGYTSFFLGARSVCPSVTMDVQFTGSWYDENMERDAATALINNGCVLISQHADSMGAPSVCEDKNVPNVSYNGSTVASCPNTFIISSKIDWTPYFVYICQQVQNGQAIAADWTGTLSTGSVALSEINTNAAAAGTAEALAAVKAALLAGELEVFDTDTFTVGGQKIADDHKADVDTDANYTADTDVVENGAFEESKFRSAPYFDLRIDGITLVNEKY